MIAVWLTIVGCLAAVYGDVQARRIPNWLTGTFVVAALVVHAFGGFRALAATAAVIVVMLLLGWILYSFGGIGGGDVKLAIAASAMIGYPLCIPFLVYTAIGAGVLAIFLVILHRSAGSLPRLVLATIGGPPAVETDKKPTVPWAIAFTGGAVLVALSQTVAPFLRI